MTANEAPISVEEAIRRVVAATDEASSSPLIELLPLSTNLLGRRLAYPLISKAPFPHFRASIMDGYAVKAPLSPGIYHITQFMHAGDASSVADNAPADNEVSYIATGAKVPHFANAVVKIEDTKRLENDMVEIAVSVSEGAHIRQIGSDIALGEEILPTGTLLTAIELGLLATTGFTANIPCVRPPIIGVMSTGNELCDPVTPDHLLGEAQVRDSNRITLIASFQEQFRDNNVVDLGIMPDNLDLLREKLLQACQQCDVLITSGGVSMGQKDYIKFLLLQDETFSQNVALHFNKLNMKPGKPTTFATITLPYSASEASTTKKEIFFFGLPGNPVSCMVTKTLFVDVALRRLQGASSLCSLHSEVSVTLIGDQDLVLDPERPEYHRVSIVSSGSVSQQISNRNNNNVTLLAYSTGNQRSSRLLSMRAANGLLLLPQGPGLAKRGNTFRALLIGPLPVPLTPVESMHASAANYTSTNNSSNYSNISNNVSLPSSFAAALSTLLQNNKMNSNANTINNDDDNGLRHKTCQSGATADVWKHIKVGIITVSDRASTGEYKDDSGPEIAKILSSWEAISSSTSTSSTASTPYPLHFTVTQTITLPDDPVLIASTVTAWCDKNSNNTDNNTVDILLTTGGTGFGPRDFTPETIGPLLQRPAPGIAQALLQEGLKHTPLAVLARPVAGTRHHTFIATLPGSVKAIRENLIALKPLLPRIMELLKTPRDEGLFSSHGAKK